MLFVSIFGFFTKQRQLAIFSNHENYRLVVAFLIQIPRKMLFSTKRYPKVFFSLFYNNHFKLSLHKPKNINVLSLNHIYIYLFFLHSFYHFLFLFSVKTPKKECSKPTFKIDHSSMFLYV